jgi:hypothetical protein
MYCVLNQSQIIGYDRPINISWNLEELKNKIKNKLYDLKEDDEIKSV